MKKRNLTNVPASVHHRLLNLARETKRPFNELLQYYTMERFLFRLGASEHAGRFVLKGALMLRVWNLPLARPNIRRLGTNGSPFIITREQYTNYLKTQYQRRRTITVYRE